MGKKMATYSLSEIHQCLESSCFVYHNCTHALLCAVFEFFPEHYYMSAKTRCVNTIQWPAGRRVFLAVLLIFVCSGCDFEARQARKELKHKTPAVRAAAISKLSQREGASAIKEIGPLINDRSPGVRLAVVKALRRIKSKKGLRYLQIAVRDPDPEIRLSAIRGLGELKDERAIPVLLSRFKDQNMVVRRAVRYALIDIGVDRGQQVEMLAQRAKNRWISLLASNRATATRVEAIRALSLSGKEEVISKLLPLLGDSDIDVVEAAALGLGRLGGDKIREAFEAGLKDPSPRVRNAVQRGIVEFTRNHPADKWTLKLLSSEHDKIREAAITQLINYFGIETEIELNKASSHKKTGALDKTGAHAALTKPTKSPSPRQNSFRETIKQKHTSKICSLFGDPLPETAFKAGLLAKHLGLSCFHESTGGSGEAGIDNKTESQNRFRRLWLRALVEERLDDKQREELAAWCKENSLKELQARLFAKLNSPKINEAIKKRAETLYEEYLYASKRWLTEKEWRSLEKDTRAREPGPKMQAPADPKAERMKELLSVFPARPKDEIILLPSHVPPQGVERVLRYLGFFPHLKGFLAKIAHEGPTELLACALEGLSKQTWEEPPSQEIVAAVKRAVTGPEETRKAGAKVLGAMGKYGISVLIQLLEKDPSEEVRAAAAAGLARTGLNSARKPLRKSAEEKLSLYTIIALQKLEDPLAVPIFLKQLKGNPPRALLEERAALIRAIGVLGSPQKETVSTLIEELDHPVWVIRASAADSLGLLKAVDAKPHLQARLKDFYAPVRRACRQALDRLKESSH